MRKHAGKITDKALERKKRRILSTRRKIVGTNSLPRIAIIKSNANLSVQLIDDSVGRTLLALNTFGKKGVKGAGNGISGAKVVGAAMAKLMVEKNIRSAVCDRRGLKYTGVIAALVTAMRENGITI